jgi:CHAT domain-containing protein
MRSDIRRENPQAPALRAAPWIPPLRALPRLQAAALAGVIAIAPAPSRSAEAPVLWRDEASVFSLDRTTSALLERHRDLEQTRGVPPRRPVAWTAAQLQAAVRPGEALLIYHQLDDRLRLHVLMADAEPLGFDSPVSPQALQSLVQRWRAAFLAPFDMPARAPVSRAARLVPKAGVALAATALGARESGQALAAALLPGDLVAQLVRGGVRHLSLLPTGELATLPWAALPAGEGSAVLVDRFSLAIAPGLGEFAQEQPRFDRRDGSGPRRLDGGLRFVVESAVVVGNPSFPESSDTHYPDLPGAALEATRVAALFKVQALLGPLATKARLLAAMPAARGVSDVLYLATHAVASSERPLDDSFIVLAGRADDASTRWTAREIQQARLRFNLAVLSACQTGLGQQHDAGVIGVARAFYLAGVPQTVMSLWNVDDAATLALMTRFAAALSRPEPFTFFPAEALRQAMLETRKTHPDPAHWASFATFGVPNVLWP